MPGVDIYYRTGFMEDPVADAIKTVVSGFAQAEFSTSKLQLGPDDFSFKFHEPSRFDVLTNDIIVRIRLNAFSERVDKIDDEVARSLAQHLVIVVHDQFDTERCPTIGVELLLASISWGTAAQRANTRRGRIMRS